MLAHWAFLCACTGHFCAFAHWAFLCACSGILKQITFGIENPDDPDSFWGKVGSGLPPELPKTRAQAPNPKGSFFGTAASLCVGILGIWGNHIKIRNESGPRGSL